ncbi:MAG: hypothetical protein ABI675_14360 [Chitinophagaceae bacterium]
MKHLFLIGFLMVVFSACQKQIDNQPKATTYLEAVKAALKDSLSPEDYFGLDFSSPVLSKIEEETNYILRIPFKGKNFQTDFVLVKSDDKGKNVIGRIVHMEKNSSSEYSKYNGSVLIRSMNGHIMVESSVINGYVHAFHDNNKTELAKAPAQADPYIELPEVVIVSSYTSGGVSYSTWASITSFIGTSSQGSNGNYYTNISGSEGGSSGGGGGGASSGGGSSSGTVNGTPIKIDFENQYADAAIDVTQFMKCFSTIPDAGAKASIEIFTDIPVNGDPDKFFNWDNGSPGHVFIQLKKENGSQSVSQNIGFYPKQGWKTSMTPAPMDGKFVDNQYHEFNASYKVSLTPAQLQTAITRVLYLARFIRYDIDDNNCTDWALNVFNEAVEPVQKLTIPRYDIPGGMAPYGTSTPQGLYKKLQQMKQAGGSNSANIILPLVGWAGASKGPCK